jgi:hypothetical protein
MGCFIALFALISPRLALFFTLLFTDRIQDAFEGWFFPVIGFFLLPWTTLFYAWAYATSVVGPDPGVTGVGWFVVGLGVFFDLTSWINGHNQRRRDA